MRVTSSNSDCKATEVALNVLSASAGSPDLTSITTRTLNEGHTSHTSNFIVPADTADATYTIELVWYLNAEVIYRGTSNIYIVLCQYTGTDVDDVYLASEGYSLPIAAIHTQDR